MHLRSLSLVVAFTSAVAAIAACGDDPVSVPPPANDAGTSSPEASAPDTSTPPPEDATTDAKNPAFEAIDAAIEDSRKKAAVDGGPPPALAFALYDKGERLVFSKEYGGFKTSDRVAVASASKIVSGLVLFSLVGKGLLTLDSTTGAVLGWPAPKDQITLRHLLSFTSGLPPEAPCTANPATTLEACVGTIAALDPDAAPGTRYDYGSTHLHVAARMAEVVTGKTWNTLFDELVRAPLGLPAEVAYFTAPRQSIGKQNPLVAGGLRASMDEYTKILTAIYARGEGAVKAPTTLFDLQMVEPYPGVVVGNSPVKNLGYDFRYGLTAWLECKTPATGCATISSPGAFGFTPWLDRKVGYTAILGMQLEREGAASGVVGFAVDLEQRLEPLLPAALGR
ncbi:MAG: serine hydrolase domain-containing protein [Polyangiaceae bacterium]